ncbi:DUF7619 domain-containing protein [Flavobacterium sp. XGLA_31]|uniref:DUF7619 domain-containing protein n=1 Tax=Flavobacterium sp. XGLA_31 TaxID=3447666 RepID=UPI003F353B8E
MKKHYTFFALFFIVLVGKAQNVSFTDPDLKAILLLASPELPIAKDLSDNFFKIDANNDGEIQLSEALQVSYIDLHVISEIEDMNGIENFTNLKTLLASNNVAVVNLNGLVNLETFDCTNNQLTALDVSGLPNLKTLNCSWGDIASLNFTGLTHLETINAYDNDLTLLDVSGLTSLHTLNCSENNITSLNLGGLSQLQEVYCNNNQLTGLDTTGLTNLQILQCSSNLMSTLNVSSLSQLTSLGCGNNQLTSLNLNGLSNLSSIDCNQNQLTALDLTGLTQLTGIYCSHNQLTSLDVSALSQLEGLLCSDNQLTSLDVSGLSHMTALECAYNQLTTLNVADLPLLSTLNANNNQIASLDVADSVNLQSFLCNDNLLTSLDVTSCHSLSDLLCNNNILTTLLIKNGTFENINLSGNPTLQYICTDEGFETETVQMMTASLPNCHVNSYCSFTPGGTFYTIQGNAHYDGNNNGCDVSDSNYPNLKLSFSDGINTGNLIVDTSGSYHYDVQVGTQTVTPVLENPAYFTVTPASATVDFPTTTSPFVQNFCVSANGTHPDLEVTLLPAAAARPGFDASYIIIYKNKGTSVQSGTVALSFDDSKLDLVSAAPTNTSSSINEIVWAFSNLQPFETREIMITMNINSPTETPAVNGGDVLPYTASVNGATDETPTDNTSTLNQIVVNSFDPNDKTCLEGNTIAPDMIGKYVHYTIRFENTGTFPAQNIVVADVIDAAKFDLSTLVPLSSSHEFFTRINGNKAEFIFENINLPFDDANNDGYVAFKIKTKPTLVIGDTFSNTANIYFDYNFPIVTNTATTIIAALGSQDFDFNTMVSLSPVPTKNLLTITTKQKLVISSISIYNTLGQLVQVNTNPNETIDVSELKPGSYCLKIVSDKGTTSTKFIKE